MKVKEFFKSNAFKSLAVLLSIVIIAGALLAIFNDLLAVSKEERLARAVAKIYGGTASVEETITIETEGDNKNDEYSTGTVNEAYLMSDGNYLVKATGKGGYGGTITAWVVLECKDSKLAGVGKVVYESDQGETLMSNVKSSFYEEFDKHDAEIADGALFWGDGKTDAVPKPPADDLISNPVTGASRSAGAICNAVNTAILFFKSAILGETIGTSLYLYSDWADLSGFEPEVDKDTKKVTYTLKMNGYGKSPAITVKITVTEEGITEYAVEGNYLQGLDSGYFDGDVDHKLLGKEFYLGKTLADFEAYLNDEGVIKGDYLDKDAQPEDNKLTTGATHSSSVLIRAAVFALANYKIALYPEQHADWLTEASKQKVEDQSVTYTLSMAGYGRSPAINVTITVTEEGISEYTVNGNYLQGTDSGYFDGDVDHKLLSKEFYLGKTLADFEAYLNEEGVVKGDYLDKDAQPEDNKLTTGATHSSSVLIRAAIYALSNYEGYLAKGGNEA